MFTIVLDQFFARIQSLQQKLTQLKLFQFLHLTIYESVVTSKNFSGIESI